MIHFDASLNRREVLQLGSAAVAGTSAKAQEAGSKKSVIVMGAGIGGLCCAYELIRLARRTIYECLEASDRPATAIIRTFHDPFADRLYADMGAEHFYYPGYREYWRYLNEFGLTAIDFPRRENLVRFLRGQRFGEADLHSPTVLGRLGFNQREIAFLAERPWADLPLLYCQRYIDLLRDETNPFIPALDPLDQIAVRDLLKRENASPTAVEFFGGSGSALQLVWGAGIKKLRSTDLESKKLFRLKGGNQLMTDSFAARLGAKIRLGCPVTSIQHGPSGVTVSYTEPGKARKLDADYLVSCISLVMLRQLPVTHGWPEAKAFVIREMPYYTRTRIVFQCRTRFWKKDNISPNWLPPDPSAQ